MRFHYNVPKPSPLLKNIKLAPVIYLDSHSSIDCDVDNMPHLDFSCSYQEAISVQVQKYLLYLLHEIDNYYCIELR